MRSDCPPGKFAISWSDTLWLNLYRWEMRRQWDTEYDRTTTYPPAPLS